MSALLSAQARHPLPPFSQGYDLGRTPTSGSRLRRGAPGVAAREQATAEKSPFQRAITVHAAAAKAGGFTGGVKPRLDLAVVAEHARLQIGLEATQRLASEDIELHRNQRAMGGIENPVRFGGADQPVADILTRIVDVHHLRVLDVGVVDLAVARLDLRLEVVRFQKTVADKGIHGADQIDKVVAHDEI